ncbi:MAG: thermonuclease family protein [Gammaproteobacteria bacterium]|nr:thermonuclease family protein [Gammaproteobacteria bacterium]
MLLPLAVQAGPACSGTKPDESVVVSYVHDGDTVHLEDGRKIRLIGINTPELARDDMPAEAYAVQAREHLQAALSRHHNGVGLVRGAESHDRYGRTLAHLMAPDGDNLQATLLLQGMAVAINHPPNTRYSECYAAQEKAARCRGAGIWSSPEQLVVPAAKLDAGSRGFQLVTGRIDHVSHSDKGVWLYMAGLKISIREHDLAQFKLRRLLALDGKRVTVRGWLHPLSKKQAGRESRHGKTVRYTVRLRHPSDMETGSMADTMKC